MDIFESLENLNVSEECFNEIMGLVEELLSETSDERARAASEESHKRYSAARNAYDITKAMIDRNKKGGFFSAEEIEELKDKLKQQKQELKNAERISVRDNRNQFNRDKRLNKIPEELLSEEDVYEPAAYAKDGYNFMATGSNKLNGKLYKVHTKHDKGVTKTKLYAKDGDSARKLVQKAYGGPDSAHTLANESLYNEIADLVEELILERNKANREAKKNWELQNRGGYHTDYLYDQDKNKESNKYYQHSKKHEVGSNQDAIHSLKKYIGDDNPVAKSHAIDQLARSSRVMLGREQDPVSYTQASEYDKNRSREDRKEQSQRGSTKDLYTRVGAPEERKEPGEILKKQEEKK